MRWMDISLSLSTSTYSSYCLFCGRAPARVGVFYSIFLSFSWNGSPCVGVSRTNYSYFRKKICTKVEGYTYVMNLLMDFDKKFRKKQFQRFLMLKASANLKYSFFGHLWKSFKRIQRKLLAIGHHL